MGVGGQTQSPHLQDWHFPLKSLQNEAMWLPYYGLGTCGIVEMPKRAGTPCFQWPNSHCPHLGSPELCAEQVALPTQSESKNVVICLPRAFISVAFLNGGWDKGCGRPQDSGGFWECIFASPNSSCPSCKEFSSILLKRFETC